MTREPKAAARSNTLRIWGVILIVVFLGMNLGPHSSIQNFINAESPAARGQTLIQVVIDLLVLLAGIALLVIDFTRRRRRAA
jgi:hypothetical protein